MDYNCLAVVLDYNDWQGPSTPQSFRALDTSYISVPTRRDGRLVYLGLASLNRLDKLLLGPPVSRACRTYIVECIYISKASTVQLVYNKLTSKRSLRIVSFLIYVFFHLLVLLTFHFSRHS